MRATHAAEAASRLTDGAGRDEVDAEAHRYYELFELAPGSYVETDAHGVVRLANLAAGDMLSIRQERLVGAELAEFVAEESREPFEQSLAGLRNGDEAKGWVMWMRRTTGTTLDVFVSVKRGWDGKGDRVLRWLLHDVSVLMGSEQQRKELPTQPS